MLNHCRLPLLSFCLVFTVWGISSCGQQVQDTAESSESSQAVTESESSTESESTESQAELEQTRTKQAPQSTRQSSEVTSKKVKVFFPKTPNSNTDFTYVESVWRTTTNEGIARFAIEELLEGPTDNESSKGFINAVQLSGSSNCGEDFTLSISQGVAKLKFCKTVVSRGVGDDARAISAVQATLKQFSTVQSVIVLDRDGNCLGDQSGQNLCLTSIKKQEKLTANSKLAIKGIGPVQVGMTVEEASRAAGVKIVTNGANTNPECVYYKPADKLEGINFMVTGDRIARVDITTKGITTISGAGIGDTEARIKSLYPGQIEVTPHPYVEEGHYLTFIPKSSADKNYRVIFETDGQRVTEFRAGKRPEVEWVEGCS